MKIYYTLDDIKDIPNPVLTTGTFDGVHVGHKKIINTLSAMANDIGGETVLFTFFPHPRMVLFPDDNDLKLINSQEEKIALLEKAGIQHLIIYPFSKEFSRLSALEFVRDILVNRVGMKKMVIGYDHQFGKNREGNLAHLQELAELFDFEVAEIPAQMVDDVNVSSTKIRNALLIGDVTTAAAYLSYDYQITGTVKKGKQLGRTIGFPTANIEVAFEQKLIPAIGVYAVRVLVNNKLYQGMMNIGHRPTVEKTNVTHLEIHLFDFNQEIYEQQITVNFVSKLRDEQKFTDLAALSAQLNLDKENALILLNEKL